ncbi:MAG TPA: helix-turn-helix transcriptional regulator [Candidatus Dormibacteraeota bacterium]|nr:helix-turn-helix transcriptional regulator [Candidatus Dormibacteraeota bacterium]
MNKAPQRDVGAGSETTSLGAALRSRRRERYLSLRDVADQTGVSLNTLSRVERGHLPDLRNFHLITGWLEMPAEHFLTPTAATTVDVIARHLRADQRLPQGGAAKIAEVVEDMYRQLISEQRVLSVHLRSATTFVPEAGTLLAEVLGEILDGLEASASD